MNLKVISNFFSLPKRKLIEIFIPVFIVMVLAFFWGDVTTLSFFLSGYCWNWAKSIEVRYVLVSKSYRFSFFRMVYNLDKIVTLPFLKFHPFWRVIPKSLPCGVFMLGVNHFLKSDLTVLPVFLGSLVYEFINLESGLNFSQKFSPDKDLPPDLPTE